MLAMMPVTGVCQLSQSNPLQYVIITEGNKKVNDKIENQTDKQGKTAALQGAIAAEYTKMKSWEEKYNSYLKTASGYAEALKAGSSIYADGVQTLQLLYDLQRAIGSNPVGMAATLAMSDLYVETATEFIKTYRMMKYALIGRKPMDDEAPTPVAEPTITPGSVIVNVTIDNDSGKDLSFDGKICFVLYGTIGSYTGYMRIKGVCLGGDYTIPDGGSKTYSVVFVNDGDQEPYKMTGLPFADSSQSGQYKSNNCFYVAGSGYTCENMGSSETFQDGGSYTMSIKGDTHEWTSAGGNNMLTGKERTDLLWQLSDQMKDLNRRIRQLTISIAYHNLTDVVNHYTAGLVDRDHATIANEAFDRWKRVSQTISSLSH